jgi:hypothetical protein
MQPGIILFKPKKEKRKKKKRSKPSETSQVLSSSNQNQRAK